MTARGRKKAEPKLLSQRGYARHRQALDLVGGNLAAVQRAILDERIPVVVQEGKRLIDPAAADEAWIANTKQSILPRRGPRTLEVAADGGSTSSGYIGARGEHESLKVELTRLDLAKKRGELIDAEAMRHEVGALARDIRRQLLLIPARIASQVRAASDDRTVEAMLDAEIRRVLIKLTAAAGGGGDG